MTPAPTGPSPEVGPSSIAWRINAERLVLLAWSRAILLQIAHPLIAAGVYDHSGFRASPRAAATRLHHTVRSMLALTFGSAAERQQAIDAILTIHRRVNGVIPAAAGRFAAGSRYSAEDPALVLWVQATLLESVLLVYGRLVRPLSDAEHDAYCVEAAPVAIALGAHPGEVPRTRGELEHYISRMYASGSIAVSGQARELAAAIVHPPGSRLVAPVTWINEVVTMGLLPAHLRSQYGFAWTPARERALGLVLGGVAAVRTVLPRQLAWWRDARRSPPARS
jgi:uncharacterized protein (DUF2236 family)